MNDNLLQESLKNTLSIFIITYNRSKYLDETLNQLVGCPFSTFPITILDNCSDDNTYQIYEQYKDLFPNFNYHKNTINIGGDANILRAVELSGGDYTWILCDDDDYDFSYCDDVLEVLKKGHVRTLFLGWTESCNWMFGGYLGNVHYLVERNFPFFGISTFVPACIVKTELFQKQIRNSYANIVNHLPHSTFYLDLYQKNEDVYISKHKIVRAGAKVYDLSYLIVFMCIFKTCLLIRDRQLSRIAFNHSYDSFKQRLYGYLLLLASSDYSTTDKIRFILQFNFFEKSIYCLIFFIQPIIYYIPIPFSLFLLFVKNKEFYRQRKHISKWTNLKSIFNFG